MKKTNSLIALAVGILLVIIGILLFISMKAPIFITLYLMLIFAGGVVSIISVFAYFFGKTLGESCSIKTSLTAILLSAVSACAMVSLLGILGVFIGGGPYRHPIAAQGYSIVFFLSVIAFLGLLILYFDLRFSKPSVKGVVIDVCFSIMNIPFFIGVAIYGVMLCEKICHMIF